MADRPLLPAVVGPWAAYVIARDFGAELERKGMALKATGQERVGGQLLQAVALLRESGRQQWEASVGSTDQEGDGSSEVPTPPVGGPSEGLLNGDAAGLTTLEVAVVLDISTRQVINLIGEDGRLTATLHKARWLIDEVSVAQELERRSSR